MTSPSNAAFELSPELSSALGCCALPQYLAQHFEHRHWPAAALSRDPSGRMFRADLPDREIDLMLQCVNPQAAPAERQWGVSSIGLPVDALTRDQITTWLGEPLITTEDMAIYANEVEGQPGCVQCQWGPGQNHITRMTWMHSGDWRELAEPQPIEPPPAPLAHTTPAPAVHPRPPAITCASAGMVPKTGWYEGRLPASHPDHAYFNQVTGRFVFMHEGQRMLTLGVVPNTDEALVVWTWQREP